MAALTRLLLASTLVLFPACFRPTVSSPDRAMRLWKSPSLWSSAGEPAQAGQPLTLELEQALRLAQQHSPALRTGRSRLGVASARVEEAKQLENPEIRLNNMRLDRLAQSETSFDLGLRIPIPRPWTMDARIRKAELQLEETRARTGDLERQLRASVRKLFARLSMLDQSEAALRVVLSQAVKQQEMAKRSLADGSATRLESSLTLLRHAELFDMQHELRLSREQTNEELRRLLGLRPDQAVVFKPPAPRSAPRKVALDEESLIQQALRRRRDLRQAASQVGMAEAELYMARAQRWPWLRFFEVDYRFRSAMAARNWELNMAIEVPLLSLNRGAIATREAQLTLQRNREQIMVLRAAQEVHRAIMHVRETTERVEELQRSLVPALESGDAAVNEAVERTTIDPLRAINVQWRRARVRHRYYVALLEQEDALIELEAAVDSTALRD
jgi:outer membrane protein TolC